MVGAKDKPNAGSIMKTIREATGASDQDIQLVLKECNNDVNEAVARLIDSTFLLDWFFELANSRRISRRRAAIARRCSVHTSWHTYLGCLVGRTDPEDRVQAVRSTFAGLRFEPSRERDPPGPLAQSLNRSIAHPLVLGRQFYRSIRVHPVQKGQDGAQEAEGREGEEGARLRAQAEWVWRRR